MMVLTVAVAFGVAVLSGLGVGSAGLLVAYLTAVAGMPQHVAQGTNLAFFLFASGAALLVHMRRTPLPVGCILLLLPGGLLGSYLGAVLAYAVPQDLLRQLFGVFLILTGIYGLFGGKKDRF